MTAIRFPKPEIVLSQPRSKVSQYSMQIDFHLPKQVPSLNLNPEVNLRLYGRRLEKMDMTS